MLGYKNDRYLYFGRCAAKLDDAANYLPSRISGGLMVLAAYFSGFDGWNAWKIFRRDSRNHASPNSAQTESVMAGALDVQLAGDAYYFGKLYEKPTIGDPIRLIEHGGYSSCKPAFVCDSNYRSRFVPAHQNRTYFVLELNTESIHTDLGYTRDVLAVARILDAETAGGN